KLEIKPGIIGETNNCISQLASPEGPLTKEHISSILKKLSKKTWDQIGELLLDDAKIKKKNQRSKNSVGGYVRGKNQVEDKIDFRKLEIREITRNKEQ
ncbi:12275_t:CDS:2, partial [Entrophospora sp. SA101]